MQDCSVGECGLSRFFIFRAKSLRKSLALIADSSCPEYRRCSVSNMSVQRSSGRSKSAGSNLCGSEDGLAH